MERTLKLTDYAGDTVEVSASCGELDITTSAGGESGIVVCLDQEQSKQLRKHIKRLEKAGLID